jgi:hypothetical protein
MCGAMSPLDPQLIRAAVALSSDAEAAIATPHPIPSVEGFSTPTSSAGGRCTRAGALLRRRFPGHETFALSREICPTVWGLAPHWSVRLPPTFSISIALPPASCEQLRRWNNCVRFGTGFRFRCCCDTAPLAVNAEAWASSPAFRCQHGRCTLRSFDPGNDCQYLHHLCNATISRAKKSSIGESESAPFSLKK